jgi:hypothetical protein
MLYKAPFIYDERPHSITAVRFVDVTNYFIQVDLVQ